MNPNTYDYTVKDSMAMPVSPIEPEQFDLARYEAYAAECDQRFAEFMQRDEGVAVWRRVRVGEVFRDGCQTGVALVQNQNVLFTQFWSLFQ